MGFRGLLRKSNLWEPGYAVRLCDIVREGWGIGGIGGGIQYRHYTYALYSRRLTAIVKTLGLPPYTSHSLRRGGASALMEAGFPVHDIRIWGDWRSLTVLLYMAKTEEARVNMDRKAVNLLFS